MNTGSRLSDNDMAQGLSRGREWKSQSDQRALVLGFGDEIRSAERHSQGVNDRTYDVGGERIPTHARARVRVVLPSPREYECTEAQKARAKTRDAEGLMSRVRLRLRLREVYGSRPRLELQLLQPKRVACKARGVQ
jgi:hypothetical protein